MRQRLLRPLTAAATYRCGVYLLLGAVVLLPYVLLTVAFANLLSNEPGQRVGTGILLALTLLIAVSPAFLAGVRSLEISAARDILGAGVPLPTGSVSAATRMRSALWYAVHLTSGGLLAAALFIGAPTGLIFILQRFGAQTQLLDTSELGFAAGVDRWWLLLFGIAVLVAIPYLTSAAGVGLRRLAPALLGPSPEERIAALEAHAEGLAERNRLARELHDSVGHALTITTVQAAAAQQVGDSDPAFATRALAAIEDAGRTAMADLDHVLGVLRAGEASSTAPQRNLADLPRLVAKPSAPRREPTVGLRSAVAVWPVWENAYGCSAVTWTPAAGMVNGGSPPGCPARSVERAGDDPGRHRRRRGAGSYRPTGDPRHRRGHRGGR